MGNSRNALAIAVDIGGTKIDMAVIDAQGKVVGEIVRGMVPFFEDGRADPVGVVEIMDQVVAKARQLPGALRGIGLSVCGNVDSETGDSVLTPNLHWRDVPLGRMVEDRFGMPVRAATDVRLAALAEAIWGAAKDSKHFAWVTIGTGFGAYFFLDGKLYEGSHGFAGNFGHVTIDEVNGYPCGCGKRGCLETYVSGPAIARAGEKAAADGSSPMLVQLARTGKIGPREVFLAESKGDPAAIGIIDNVVRLVAMGLAGLTNILDLELIVVGGGVAGGSPEFLPRVDHRLREFLMTEEAKRDLRIVPESLPNAALFGAAASLLQRHGDLVEE